MNTLEANPTAHILVVDDDRDIRELLARFLKKHGFRVTTAVDGKEMRRAIADWSIDLVVLDLMLPGEDGLSLCRNLRAKSSVPIIMLTMMNEETDRIIGLEMGADDYLPKPFNPRELLARMKAVLRRTKNVPDAGAQTRPKTLHFSGWRLEIGRRQLQSENGLLIDLSAGEFDLLVALALLLVIEGILPFLSPDGTRRTMLSMVRLSNSQLRNGGLVLMGLGLLALYFIK